MMTVETMNLTISAQEGIRSAGMAKTDALKVIHGLSRTNFYKSMTTNKDSRVWQDVYRAQWRGKLLYLKFQQAGDYFVLSFKEL